MGEHKMNISDVARATGVHRNMVTLLHQETASRVDLESINRLCAFFNVQVGELFEFIPDTGMRKSA
jgi:putative transcriptional regulator